LLDECTQILPGFSFPCRRRGEKNQGKSPDSFFSFSFSQKTDLSGGDSVIYYEGLRFISIAGHGPSQMTWLCSLGASLPSSAFFDVFGSRLGGSDSSRSRLSAGRAFRFSQHVSRPPFLLLPPFRALLSRDPRTGDLLSVGPSFSDFHPPFFSVP